MKHWSQAATTAVRHISSLRLNFIDCSTYYIRTGCNLHFRGILVDILYNKFWTRSTRQQAHNCSEVSEMESDFYLPRTESAPFGTFYPFSAWQTRQYSNTVCSSAYWLLQIFFAALRCRYTHGWFFWGRWTCSSNTNRGSHQPSARERLNLIKLRSWLMCLWIRDNLWFTYMTSK